MLNFDEGKARANERLFFVKVFTFFYNFCLFDFRLFSRLLRLNNGRKVESDEIGQTTYYIETFYKKKRNKVQLQYKIMKLNFLHVTFNLLYQ